MDTDVIAIANEFRATLLLGEQATVATLLDAWRDVEEQLLDEMERFVATLDGPLTRRELLRLQRFQALLAQVDAQVHTLEAVATGAIDAGQAHAALLGLDLGAAMIESLAVGISFNRLPVAAVENLVALARAGQPLAALLQPIYGLAAEGIIRELIGGLALGLSPREIARRMAADGLTDSLNHLLLVTRDQYNRAHRLAGLQAYRASGVVDKWVRISARDGRTCAACIALDGTVYDVGEDFESHPQCRCTTVPQVRGVRPLSLGNGAEWFEAQPEAVQRRIMGPGVYDRWRTTGFDLGRMVSYRPNATWGRSPVPTPLRDL